MKSTRKQAWRVGIFLFLIGAIGCTSSPRSFDYHDDREEKPGPGLFSGDDGVFVIYGGSQAENKDQPDPPKKTE